MPNSYQAAPYKYAPVATSNVIALPLWWRNWYLVVAGLSLFFATLALGKLVRMTIDKIRNDKYQNDWS